ncbi:plasmid partitioning protein RepB C-terminal domain-containing protein [Variovorax sp. VaC1]|uniref:plasmid partitioning protein RepB C-terminal domain-containing protein n=1 Tax=Variovorax sp. VaC1 TaxID=3373132 RepID=UPI00374951D0
MSDVVLGFLPKPMMVAVNNILPSRKPPVGLLGTQKYKLVLASIGEIGLIEPLTINAVDRRSGQHVLLDGHIRLHALIKLGYSEVACLVATDDEGYTYNNRINRLSSIQEHLMLRRAIERGVSPERLAKALCVDLSQITKKANLLDGICLEAAELMKDRQFSPEVAPALRRMKPMRQVEVVELMISSNNMTVAYVRALLMATPSEMLMNSKAPSRPRGVSQEQMNRMEHEMTGLHDQYKMIEQSFGEDMLNLVLAKGYVAKLIDNKAVFRYLERSHAAVLEQLVSLVRTTTIDV